MPSNPPPPDNEVTVKINWVDLLFKAMSALVIPLVLWGVRLETQLATQELRLSQLERDNEGLKGDVKIAKEQAVQLAVLAEQIKNANKTLDEIKNIVNASSRLGH